MKLSPEELYQIYHKETNEASGRHVRAVKNFDNAKKKSSWEHFELLSTFIERNCGQVNGRIYIKSLAVFFEGWFDPKIFCTPKGTKIYKEYISNITEDGSSENIKKHLLSSIKYIIQYCKAKKIKSFCEYMNEDLYFIPTVLKHHDAGSVSMYFLVAVKNIRIYIQSYPIDCRLDYIPEFDNDYGKYRMRLVSNKDLKNLFDNVEEIIDEILTREE